MSDPRSALVAELRQEAASTRRLLERLPEARLGWQPHPKSMTLGRLAGHIGELLIWGQRTVEEPEVDLAAVPEGQRGAVAESVEQLLGEFDRRLERFAAALEAADEEGMYAPWRLRHGEQLFFELPRIAALRGFVISHLVHHRGQLTVYLRLLEVPLPQVYGPTADEGW